MGWFVFIWTIISQYDIIIGLTCFNCPDIGHPRFCDHVKICDQGQVCGLERTVDIYGDKTFRQGCMHANTCNSYPTSKNSSDKCYQCCSSDLCNMAGCGEQDHNITGTICYQCQGQLKDEVCHKIGFCDVDEFNVQMCYTTEETRFTEKFYHQGCKEKHLCRSLQFPNPVIGKRDLKRSTPHVNCCSGNFCNSRNQRTPQETTTTTPTVGSNTVDLKIKTCSDIKEKTDGVYHIYPTGKPGYKVYCDMTTDGGGWTVFQRRINGKLSFYDKLWTDYAKGFGQVDQEYWLGNDKLHLLTTNWRTYALRINLMDWDGQLKYAVYDNIKVDNSSEGYKLHIGQYHGNAGNSMKYNNEMPFTTIDRQNDGRSTDSCASINGYRGAWWYNSGCGYSNLNGEYATNGTGFTNGRGMHWGGFRGFNYSLKYSQMMIRRQ